MMDLGGTMNNEFKTVKFDVSNKTKKAGGKREDKTHVIYGRKRNNLLKEHAIMCVTRDSKLSRI